MWKPALLLISVLSLTAASFADEPQCGIDAGGKLCRDSLCCSKNGFCGNASAYCGDGCQSQCHIDGLISEELFEEMLNHRNDDSCPGKGFYTYEDFISAANSFPDFGNKNGTEIRKREIAAFLAQTSHQTRGLGHPGDPFGWGYCIVNETWPGGDYCVPSDEWPCVEGKQYYGRGPIQLQFNYNYGPIGADLYHDLLTDPDDLGTQPKISFQSALWFWMTPQYPKPSCHDVITGQWKDPHQETTHRSPGYGVITNIINGTGECGHGYDANVANRIGFYKRYCGLIGVSAGDNLDCYDQKPFGELGFALPM